MEPGSATYPGAVLGWNVRAARDVAAAAAAAQPTAVAVAAAQPASGLRVLLSELDLQRYVRPVR